MERLRDRLDTARLALATLDDQATEAALDMADDRNLTSHIYREALALEVFGRLPAHAAALDAWLEAMGGALPDP